MGSLTAEQEAIIVGCLLGDGAMRCKTNALLEVNHSLKQRAYVEWKHAALRDLVATPPRVRRAGPGRMAVRFTTRSLPKLTRLYRRFYRGGRKVVPHGMILSPLSLAVWLMDDGSRSRKAVYLNTQQFSLASQQRLIRYLRQQYGLKSTLNADKQYRRLRIAVESMPRFQKLVGTRILPSFQYKLPS